MTELRLILGDQLNPHHSWFDTCSPNIIYVMLELRAETDYVLHHAQKVIAIFAAMRAIGYPVALLARALERLARGFTSMT